MPHVWITGRYSRDRLTAAADVGLPELVPPVDAHRRLRGPYTMGGALLRSLIPDIRQSHHELIHRHDTEVLCAAPELRATISASRETLTSLAVPKERTRFYSRLRTRRIANGLADLLREYLTGEPQRMLIVDNAHDADPTDAELLAILLRRLDPVMLTLVICTVPEPTAAGAELTTALGRYARERHAAATAAAPARQQADGDRALAVAYITTDCTSDDPALLAAYARLAEADRARLHDARADELADRAEPSLLLGAVPFHRERGSDPAGAGAAALQAGLDYCIDMGFYHATVDFGHRGRAVIDWSSQEQFWWTFTTKMTTSLAALGRAAEAEDLYDEARRLATNPKVHQQAAYATAMLYTRHHEPESRDHGKALAWINQAIAIASLLPDPAERAFQTVFAQNGRALVEVHLGNLAAALQLVDAGLARLSSELRADEHRLHRSVLLYNRAQVLVGLGRLEDALADYTAVIAADPNYAEYYLDRGNILRRMGRDLEALADYESAIRLSPPFPEVHYNRADVLLTAGDLERGLSGLDYVLELDPEYLDAYVNRAGVRLALGDEAGAAEDVAAGLAIDPGNPHLHCVLGQLHADAGRIAEARSAFDQAIERDPALQVAWAGRAALAHQAGDAAAAVADLDRAIELGDDAALRYNRAIAYESLGRHAEALADLDVAAQLDPADTEIARERLRFLEAAGGAPQRLAANLSSASG